MESKSKIVDFMINEHGEMFNTLVQFRFQISHLHDNKIALEKFIKFKNKLTPHHDAEENLIFPKQKNPKYLRIIKVLKQQHKLIEAKVAEIENILTKQEDVFDASAKLQEILREHVKFEEKSFYPKLDNDLSEEQKNNLIQSFSESIKPKKGFFEKISGLFQKSALE